MSRLNELKKQYPHLNMSFFDLMTRIDPSKSYKYLSLLCKILSERLDMNNLFSKDDTNKAKREITLQLERKSISTKGLNDLELYTINQLSDYWPKDTFDVIKDFIFYMEGNKIENKDVTSYKNLNEMQMAISVASLKEMNEVLSKQTIKEFEDETWVAVRPLTFQASAKYGAGTRWCTTYQQEKQYFERYWRQGILVYFINKKTGYKFAMYKSLEEKENTFWNSQDKRLDFMDLEIDDYLYPIIKKISKSELSNKHLSSDDIQKIVHSECLGQYEKSDEEPSLRIGTIGGARLVAMAPRPIEIHTEMNAELGRIFERETLEALNELNNLPTIDVDDSGPMDYIN